ncbi:hypothetical protein [Vibrio metschnikovii]|uniref:hypothetical protein n=1 Tax=Vibrio metschnikovii TaxID=28172 RepID=UPI00164A1BFB|nr:hypothetical protein [Vibrio metschnikovii]MBC5830878.1 hypothetical protein [Vibrio metschnikovii]
MNKTLTLISIAVFTLAQLSIHALASDEKSYQFNLSASIPETYYLIDKDKGKLSERETRTLEYYEDKDKDNFFSMEYVLKAKILNQGSIIQSNGQTRRRFRLKIHKPEAAPMVNNGLITSSLAVDSYMVGFGGSNISIGENGVEFRVLSNIESPANLYYNIVLTEPAPVGTITQTIQVSITPNI